MQKPTELSILVADDDPDDCLLLSEAFEESSLNCKLTFVRDGEELLKHLAELKDQQKATFGHFPDLILLDLNMPRVDGREALIAVKSDEDLRHIPVIVLTTSQERDDVLESYMSGSNSFIIKPSSFSALKDVVSSIEKYWLDTTELPRN